MFEGGQAKVLDLRFIKILVPGVLILYLYKRRLPFLVESLTIRSATGLTHHRSDAIECGDMTLQERFITVTLIFLYLLLPDWIRMPW
jgi:hypothetical protein